MSTRRRAMRAPPWLPRWCSAWTPRPAWLPPSRARSCPPPPRHLPAAPCVGIRSPSRPSCGPRHSPS
eukprot:5739011-Pleurochrysis_carterae.AAC.1